MITTINPSTEEPLASYPAMNQEELGEVIALADSHYHTWRKTDALYRRECMQRLSALLTEEADRHAELISLEMGKPLSQAVAEVKKSAWVCDYYALHAEQFLQPEETEVDGMQGLVKFEPMGLVLGVMPGTFPFGRCSVLPFLQSWPAMAFCSSTPPM